MTTSPDDSATTDDLNARPEQWPSVHDVLRIFNVLAVGYGLDTDDDTTQEALIDASEAIATRMHETLDALTKAGQ